MKHLFFYFFLLVNLSLASCAQEYADDLSSQLGQTSQFKLISKKEIKMSDQNEMKLRSMSYTSAYESSIPIYRYIYYGSRNDMDHLFATENNSSFIHDGNKYNLENQPFNLMQDNYYSTTVPLYRHYSLSLNDHILSTSSSVNSYVSEGIIGYIFSEQQIGTVPLKELYSSERQSHHYVVSNAEIENWIAIHDSDYKYQKTIGYVYFGPIADEKKVPTEFIINYENYNSSPVTVYLTMKVRERDSYFELTYSADMPGEKSFTMSIPIPNEYTVVAADLKFKINIYYETIATFENITNPNFYQINDHASTGGNVVLYFKRRTINGYKATFDITWDVPLGC